MIALLLAVALAAPLAEPDIGPQPSVEEFAALAEPALASKFLKPESATFTWPYRLVAGPIGYYTCGKVHARDNRGTYSDRWVSAVVAKGSVVNFQSEDRDVMTAYSCKKKVRTGEFKAR